MNRDLLTKPFARELIKERSGPHGKRVRYVDVHAVFNVSMRARTIGPSRSSSARFLTRESSYSGGLHSTA
jgi:hypothetical protein